MSLIYFFKSESELIMGFNSKIQWTTHTYNPWWGCTKVSDGCKNCYAESFAVRYGHDIWGIGKQRRLLSENHWKEPLKWNNIAKEQNERHRVFCASMADVFEENAPQGEVKKLWGVIKQTSNLDWLLLTKRPHRILDNLPDDWGNGYKNVWLGTSVEDERVVERINHLVSVPAAIHFLSLEPLLGPLPNLPLKNIDWVIVGGESGAGSRPMKLDWVLDIHQQCLAANTAFFLKQTGNVLAKQMKLTDKKGGNIEEWPEEFQLRSYPLKKMVIL